MTENFKFSPSRLPKIIKSFSREIDELFGKTAEICRKINYFFDIFRF